MLASTATAGLKGGAVWLRAEGYIRVYSFRDNGRRLELVHRTAVGGIPGALTGFKVLH